MLRWIQNTIPAVVACLLVGANALAAQAKTADVPDKGPVLVELFTSQGCSSCPPANRFLAQLGDNPDVVALSFAVNYWDYLGWKDTYARPEFTIRQQAYNRMLRERRLFTPQFVIDGVATAGGTPTASIEGMIFGTLMGSSEGPGLQLHRDGQELIANVGAGKIPAHKKVGIYLANYLPGVRKVTVTEGENEGRKVEQVNMVTSFKQVGEWTGKPVQLTLPVPAQGSSVLILQEEGPGRVLGITRESGYQPSMAAIAPKTN